MAASWQVVVGDCRDTLAGLEAQSVQTVVTSPPYFGLRDYGTGEWEGGDAGCDHRHDTARQKQGATSGRNGRANVEEQRNETFRRACCRCGARRVDRQIGLEPSPDEFVQALVGVFREVRRVLRDDGTVWLNLGDSYSGYHGNARVGDGPAPSDKGEHYRENMRPTVIGDGIKPKNLLGMPWRVAFALQADGWILRADIIWSKPNPMPESVTDRPTKAHEYVFLLSKGPRYFYDADAIREEGQDWSSGGPGTGIENTADRYGAGNGGNGGLADLAGRYKSGEQPSGRNKRSVWTVATQPFPGAHFATFPPKLIEPCILAGTSPRACGVCGAPWQRLVRAEGGTIGKGWHGHENDLGRGQRGGDDGNQAAAGWATYKRTTAGWAPTCDHDDDSGRCVVLDPFAGAGTTGLVALRHDRSFIGLELSPEYARMARERIVDDAPLLNSVSEVAA